MKFSTALMFSLLGFSSISHAAPGSQRGEGGFTPPSTKRLATLADALFENSSHKPSSLPWIYAGDFEDGTYVAQDPSALNLMLWDIRTNTSSIFVDTAGLGLVYYNYSIQWSAKHVLFSANHTKQYRHSYFADYYIWSVEAKTLVPLVEGQSGDVQYATWSPHGNVIAYVRGNDLFIWKDGVSTRVTNDGGENCLTGCRIGFMKRLEIFGGRHTLWFSPDGEYLAFLKFDGTGVPTYTVPRYMAGQEVAPPYPEERRIRYPKVGEKNPTLTFHLLEVNNPSVPWKIDFQTYTPDNLAITEVAWAAEKHERVIFRTQNRTQDAEKLVLVDVESGDARVVRERNATDGWLDNNLAITYVPGLSIPSYLDISDHSGWAHIYLYPVAGVDTKSGLVYYQSTERDSTERHSFSVNLDGKTKKSLVDITKEGYYDASFSPGGGYYILSFSGPGLPWQELRSISPDTPVRVINDNASLKNKLSKYTLPTISWSTLKNPDGYVLNFVEYLPPNFHKGRGYPVLFRIYGGPGSQRTQKAFRQTIDFITYLGSDPELEYIVITVDNRGTGFKGRKLRSLVTGQLGKLEAEDQVWAAREYAKRDYVDGEKIAIWGWSYGGYLAGKVLELDSGVFSLGLMTVPATDWRLYDTMFTERHTKLLATNRAGYNASAITKMVGFKNAAGGFLIQYGTGDDNAHFQHGDVLVDTLMYGGVGPEKMRVQWFTDSDHNIKFHGASVFLYKQLAKALYDEKRGIPEGKHQWSRRGFERG
ncbi:putative dipeptidyl peptidase IV (Dpp4) [Tuber indicum]|nr:putative dipeptidyl peptidase IV (Dpp4) [Tuber indicum]